MTARLNGDLLRQRRIDAQIGIIYAAELLGVGTRTLTRIETGDTEVTRAINVQGLLDLADALGCAPADLFDNEPDSSTETTRKQVDPQHLVGVLHEQRTQIPIKDLATIFNTSNASIRKAAHDAETHLAGTGLRLGRRDDHFFVTTDHPEKTKSLVTALAATSVARHGIDKGQARILKQILDGRLTNGRQSTYTKTSVGLLLRLGMITTSKNSGHIPSDALRYALDV